MSTYVELKKGKVRYFYHLKSSNGRILSVSQKYWSYGNAKRAARKVAQNMHYKFIEV